MVEQGDDWAVVVTAPDGKVYLVRSREEWSALKAKYDVQAMPVAEEPAHEEGEES
jgi:hypothetical protein